VRDPRLRALASRVRYVVDPGNPYPRRFTGHVKLTLDDGSVVEVEKPHMRGGADEPLSTPEIEAKFAANVRFGGGSDALAAKLLGAARAFAEGGPIDLGMPA
jgi:2-methylcitrate dehydratase PrpD